MAVPAPDGDTPKKVGRYEILGHLATGGMARIYLAKAGGIGAFERYVVLKTILPDRATDQRFVTMFLDEARLAATLNHQNIAQVYEVDEADGNLFITMEYVHGENLRTILETTLRKGWTIPVELAVMIVSSAAAGLHHAHERKGKTGQPLNIVHRDVSPANIMVGYDGATKLLDFGIAKAEERSTKTQQGTIKGKYGYMSPEQCRGKPIDRRSDIFALGIVLYEITTLRRAFRGNDDFDTMRRIVNGDLVPPSVAVPGYPRELEAIVLTAMARDPDFRFQSSQEMLEALDAFMVRAKLQGSPSTMARFMTQLFGVRKEPWVEGAERLKRPSEPQGGDATEISAQPAELAAAMVAGRQPEADRAHRAATVEASELLSERPRSSTVPLPNQGSNATDEMSVTTEPRGVTSPARPEVPVWTPPRAPSQQQPVPAPPYAPHGQGPTTLPPGMGPAPGGNMSTLQGHGPVTGAPHRPSGNLPRPPGTAPGAAYPPPSNHSGHGHGQGQGHPGQGYSGHPPGPGSGPVSTRRPVAGNPIDTTGKVPALPQPFAGGGRPGDPLPAEFRVTPSRRSVWIIMIVLFLVIGVVVGTIVLGLTRSDPEVTAGPAADAAGLGSGGTGSDGVGSGGASPGGAAAGSAGAGSAEPGVVPASGGDAGSGSGS